MPGIGQQPNDFRQPLARVGGDPVAHPNLSEHAAPELVAQSASRTMTLADPRGRSDAATRGAVTCRSSFPRPDDRQAGPARRWAHRCGPDSGAFQQECAVMGVCAGWAHQASWKQKVVASRCNFSNSRKHIKQVNRQLASN